MSSKKLKTRICIDNQECIRSGGQVVQISPPDPKSASDIMRCCGIQRCKKGSLRHHTSGGRVLKRIVAKPLVSKRQSFIIASVRHK